MKTAKANKATKVSQELLNRANELSLLGHASDCLATDSDITSELVVFGIEPALLISKNRVTYRFGFENGWMQCWMSHGSRTIGVVCTITHNTSPVKDVCKAVVRMLKVEPV